MATETNSPAEYELMVLALQCRDLSSVSEYPALKEQLVLLAEDYEAALASLKGEIVSFDDGPLV